MQILAIGDLHLGRHPARSSAVIGHLERASDISPRAAWDRCVAYGVDRDVTAVVLTGDLVEQPRDFYEAHRDLARGVERLREAGIAVVAVAGNHDYEILPELARSIDGFRLLGAGGDWESCVVSGTDGGVELVGWSFTGERALSPLPDAGALPAREAPQLPRLGLLHCDRDAAGSPHAPVKGTTLAAADVDGWLLGHIHRPDALTGPKPNGYLGSAVGLDPTEDGPRGPWRLAIDAGGTVSIEHVVLAPLRWALRTIDITDLGAPGQIHGRILEDRDALDAEIEAEVTQRPVAVGRRLRLTGTTSWRREIGAELERADPRAEPTPRHGTVYFVDAWRIDARPAVDLAAYAEGDDPAGLLARRLLLLDGPDTPARRELVRAARQHLADIARLNSFARLGRGEPSEAEVLDYLRRGGLEALDRLIAQRESAT